MAVNSGPQISRTGLVAYYDVSNEKSFRGLNTTNLMYGINFYNMGGDTAYYKSSSGTESVFIPYFNQLVNVTYADVYNDYNASIAQYGGNYCCPSLFSYHSGVITVSGSTTYMYQIIFKTDTGYYNSGYMYRYEHGASGYISEAGLVDSSRLENLGDGWYHAWGSFTTNAATTTLYCYLFHYEYATWNRVRVAAVCLTQGSVVHRPEHILNLGYRTARGTTVATGGGLKDLIGSNGLELVNGVSFASGGGGSLVFDGVNDYLSVPQNSFPSGSCSFEIIFKHTHSLVGSAYFISPTSGSLQGYQIYFRGDWAGDFLYFLRFTTGSSYYGDSAWGYATGILQSVPANTLTHIIFTHDTTTDLMRVYVNGVLTRTTNAALNVATGLSTGYGAIASTNVTHVIGASNTSGNSPLAMNLYLLKVYNTALTAAEVLTNYRASRPKIASTTNRNIILARQNTSPNSTSSLFTSIMLYIDASNKQSYTSGSQFIYDLSPNKRKFTMYTNGGSTYYLTAYGSIPLSSEGKGTLQFDGTNDWIHLNENITAPTAVTISVWVKISVSGLKGIISHCSGGPVNLGYSIDTTMKYVYYSNQWNTETGYANINDGNWKMVTWVKSGTNMKLYVNGVLDKDITLVADVIGSLRAIGTSWGPCSSNNGIMGVLAYGPGSDSYGTVFNGLMGPFMIWSRALSATDITTLWNNFRSRYNLNNIVTSGLVLHLSAFDRTSYSGSGTTWTDLSGNANTGTLTNGPTFNTSGGGNLTFDGTNDYVDFTAANLTTTATVEMWCKIGAGYSSKMFFGWLYYDVWCSGGTIGYNTGNGDVFGISSAVVSSLGCVGNWKHYIFEMRSDVSYTNNKIYINGVSQTVSQQLSSEFSSNRNFNGGLGRIATWRASADYCIPMDCAIFRVYNRSLSAAEISQNFNVDRWRFGV